MSYRCDDLAMIYWSPIMHPMQLSTEAQEGEEKLLYLLLSVGLVLAAGLMSGLTLGLMSMDSKSDLHAF